MQRLALLNLTLFLQVGCSQMIWKDASLTPQISQTTDSSSVLILEVHYQEKDSWNPLNGTTDKRKYTTNIDLVKTANKKVTETLKSWEIPSWALADSAFYHAGEKSLVLLHGRNDEYGTLDQKLSVYPFEKPSFSYPATPENLVIFQASPSPNGKSIALITAVSAPNWEFSEFELRILDPNTQKVLSFPLSFWTALPLYGIRWSNDSNTLYVRTPEHVLALRNEKLEITKSFPDCYTPSTNFGRAAYGESFVESQNPLVLGLGEKKADLKMITSLEKIKICP